MIPRSYAWAMAIGLLCPVVSSRHSPVTIVALRGGGTWPAQYQSSSISPRFIPKSRPWSSSQPSTSVSPSTKEQDRISAKEQMDAFLTRDSRNSFISRVYAILAGQLLVTVVSVVLFGTHPGWTAWMVRSGSVGMAVPAVSLLLSTIAWVVMYASTTYRRVAPVKWQLLALFTLGEAVSVGFVSSFYQFRSVVSAMLATAVAATGVSLYTIFQTNGKYDLSQWGASLSSMGLILVVYGIIQLLQATHVLPAGFLPYNEMVYGLLGATLFSFYLAYHTKLIVAGKQAKYQMNEQDYVFGAMTLYNDIINLFIYLLKAMGDEKHHD